MQATFLRLALMSDQQDCGSTIPMQRESPSLGPRIRGLISFKDLISNTVFPQGLRKGQTTQATTDTQNLESVRHRCINQ